MNKEKLAKTLSYARQTSIYGEIKYLWEDQHKHYINSYMEEVNDFDFDKVKNELNSWKNVHVPSIIVDNYIIELESILNAHTK